MKPVNKTHELALRNEEARIDYEPDMMNQIYLFMIECGMIRKGKGRKDQVLDFHRSFALEHKFFPGEVYYSDLYPAFITFALSRNPRPGGVVDAKLLFRDWYKEAKPPKPPDPPKEVVKPLFEDVKDFDPKTLQEQYEIITTIYDPEKLKYFMNFPKTYAAKVINEMYRRELIKTPDNAV